MCSEHWQPHPVGQVGRNLFWSEWSNGLSNLSAGRRNQRRWQSKQLTCPQLRQGISIPFTTSPQMTQGSLVGSGCRGLQLGHRRTDDLRWCRLEGVFGARSSLLKMESCNAWPQLAQWRWKSRAWELGSGCGSFNAVSSEPVLFQYWLEVRSSTRSVTAPIFITSLC